MAKTMARFPKLSSETPPKGAEKSLLEAIERLRSGTPRNPDLQERMRARKLKINATTATTEAGCARRLAYAFPRVRQALEIDRTPSDAEDGPQPRSGRKSLQEIVTQLRADKAELKRERDEALSKAAALIIRMRNVERDAEKAVSKVIREANRPTNTNQMAGNVHKLFGKREDAEQ